MRNPDDPAGFAHRTVEAGGLTIHFVEEGSGPLVILLHGFPYTWFEWRRQILALADAGFRVVAPDIRGFGQSGKPPAIADYTLLHCAEDVIALLAALGEQRAILVGHDLGAWVATAAVRVRGDLFPALALISTVIGPREPQHPSLGWAALKERTGGQFYHAYFQQPGLAEQELDRDIALSLRSMYHAISGEAQGAGGWRLFVMPGEGFLDTVPDPGKVPGWLGEQAFAEYVAQYSQGGFAAPLSHYRCRELSWELTEHWAGQPITQPAMFIGGAADPAMALMRPNYDAMEQTYPALQSKCLLEGIGHGAPEEAPDQVSAALIAFCQAQQQPA